MICRDVALVGGLAKHRSLWCRMTAESRGTVFGRMLSNRTADTKSVRDWVAGNRRYPSGNEGFKLVAAGLFPDAS